MGWLFRVLDFEFPILPGGSAIPRQVGEYAPSDEEGNKQGSGDDYKHRLRALTGHRSEEHPTGHGDDRHRQSGTHRGDWSPPAQSQRPGREQGEHEGP